MGKEDETAVENAGNPEATMNALDESFQEEIVQNSTNQDEVIQEDVVQEKTIQDGKDKKKEKKKCLNFNKIYLIAFIVLNLVNAFLITSPYLEENMLTYQYDIFMIANSLIGNLSCIIMFVGIGQMIFKKKKSFNMYLMIITGVLCLFLFGIGIFCNYYGMMFGFEALENFGSDGGGDAFIFFVKSLPDVMKMSSPIFFLALLIMLVAYIVYCKKVKKETFVEAEAPRRQVKLGLSVTLLGLFFLVFSTCIYNTSNKDTWFEYNANDLHSVQGNGVYSHFASEIGRYTLDVKKKINKDDKEKALSIIEEQGQGLDTNAYTNMFKDKNLLLIQMESINNFLIGLEVKVDGKWVEITPNMNKLVKENIYFDNFYTSVGMGNTSDAEFSAMTGLYPIGYTYTVFDYPDRTYEALPRLFEAKGYNAFSVHANSEKFYDRGKCHKQMYGFQEHYGEEKLNVTEDNKVHEWLSDEAMLTQAVDKMYEQNKANNNKSFCFAVTITNHTPFNEPKNAISKDKWFANKDNIMSKDLKLNNSHILNNLFKGYLEYVCYTDFAIGKAMDRLKELGMYDDTVIMMYGDHGIVSKIYDMFYDYPELFRNEINPIIKKDHKRSEQKLLELQMLNEIPFIIANPSLSQQTIHLTRSEDNIKSTVSNMFGLDARFVFNRDCFSDEHELCYSPKTEVVYFDGLVINTRNKKGVYVNSSKEYNIKDIVKGYRFKRDLNDKILNYDLLKDFIS